ncbi:MAG TPA: hypothetical protein PLW35_00310 [Verrucomicrobiota bacterium]|nr:hypothetical protein [Verrucomicrobiota bacterium]HOK76144.1 hypothetical protein [Verrucomicrobiota bacterium]
MSANRMQQGSSPIMAVAVVAVFMMIVTALSQQTDLMGSVTGTSTNKSTDSTLERPITPGTLTPPEPLDSRKPLGGALPAFFRSPQPLQMINPLAPREYGDGTQHLSTNLLTGEAEGVTLLSIRLPSKPHKLKKSTPPKKTR